MDFVLYGGKTAMANWLNSQERVRAKERDSQDIRKFVRVHGKIITSSSKTESKEREEKDSDDFSTQPPSSMARSTKQLTLSHFKKQQQLTQLQSSKDTTEKQEGVGKSCDSQQLFLPAVKFSTGVRRKATKVEVEDNKENLASQETERTVEQSMSPLRRANHKSPCSVQKKRRRERLQPLSPSSQLPPAGTKKRSDVIIESGCGFLSARMKTFKYKGQFSREASEEGATDLTSEVASEVRGELKPEVKKDELRREKDQERAISQDLEEDSDLYIDTDELLEKLSNCEKTLINAHTNNDNNIY